MIGSLFSGIGGLELGLERAGLGAVAWQSERDPFCRMVLRRHWPAARLFNDVREVTSETAGPIRVLCGGFPCQPVSVIGAGRGAADPRWLWPECIRIANELQPEWCIWENVPMLRQRGLCGVLGDLAASGWDAEWLDLRASDVGAPHRRSRIFIVCHRSGERLDRFARAFYGIHDEPCDLDEDCSCGSEAVADTYRERFQQLSEARLHDHGAPGDDPARRGAYPPGPDDVAGWGTHEPRPLLRRGSDGAAEWMDRIRALGNAVVPSVAEAVGLAITASESP